MSHARDVPTLRISWIVCPVFGGRRRHECRSIGHQLQRKRHRSRVMAISTAVPQLRLHADVGVDGGALTVTFLMTHSWSPYFSTRVPSKTDASQPKALASP